MLFQYQTVQLLYPAVFRASSGCLHTIKSSCQLPESKIWTQMLERVLVIELSGT